MTIKALIVTIYSIYCTSRKGLNTVTIVHTVERGMESSRVSSHSTFCLCKAKRKLQQWTEGEEMPWQ